MFFSSCGNKEDQLNQKDSLNVGTVSGSRTKIDSSVVNYIDENGKRQGYWKISGEMTKDSDYSNSDLIEEGMYLNNLKTGEWINYEPDGIVKEKVNYVDGKIIATIPISSKAKISQEIAIENINFMDAKGLRQGHWKIYGAMQRDITFPPEMLYEEGNYSDGLKDGEWKKYNSDGTVKEKVQYKDGKIVK